MKMYVYEQEVGNSWVVLCKGRQGGEAIGPEVKGEMGACSKKRGHEGRGEGGGVKESKYCQCLSNIRLHWVV